MNERIKALRKALNLTQQEFGDRIGIKRNSVALIENGRNTSDQTIFSICREFNVSEEWLRTGKGEMFNPAPDSELDALAKKYDLSNSAYVLIEKFVGMKKEQQDVIIDFMKEVVAGLSEAGTGDFKPSHNSASAKLNIDAEVEAYRRSLEQQEKAAARLSASNGQNDIGIGDTDERKLS